MSRLVLLGVSLTAMCCSAATIQTYYSESAFDGAIRSGSFTTESFSGNQINTPGLTVSACDVPSYPSASPSVCSPLSKAQLTSAYALFQTITGNMFTDAVGRYPSNPYTVNNGVGDYSTLFTLPESVTAVGFDLNETSFEGANFGITLGSNLIQYPFGGVEGPNESVPGLPKDGYSYSGYVGFTSDQAFDTIRFSAFYNPGVAYTLDNLTFGDPTPEPATFAFAGIGIAAVLMLKRFENDSVVNEPDPTAFSKVEFE